MIIIVGTKHKMNNRFSLNKITLAIKDVFGRQKLVVCGF